MIENTNDPLDELYRDKDKSNFNRPMTTKEHEEYLKRKIESLKNIFNKPSAA